MRILLIILLLSMGCSSGNREQKRTENTAVFAIFSSDTTFFSKEGFNSFSHAQKTANNVHLFAHPSSAATLDGVLGQKHFVEQAGLSKAIVDVLRDSTIDRLIFFIDTHGAPKSGNWCYENASHCSLTEDFLLDMLDAQATFTTSPLKEIFLVPLSCHNKIIMDRFSERASHLTLPFNVSMMQQLFSHTCATGSIGHDLLDRHFTLINPRLSDDELERYFSLSTVNELIDFKNLVDGSDEAWAHLTQFEITHLRNAVDIYLKDYALNLSIKQRIYKGREKPLPQNVSVKEFLTGQLSPQFFQNVEVLEFRKENQSRIFPVHGDLSSIIEGENFNYTSVFATLRNKPE